MIPAFAVAPPAGVRVLIATRPVNFRRGADGLAATVPTILRQDQQDPFCGTIFVFRSKRADRVLVYDGTGLVLIRKRLEDARFKWPATSSRCERSSPITYIASPQQGQAVSSGSIITSIRGR
jgi:transposase